MCSFHILTEGKICLYRAVYALSRLCGAMLLSYDTDGVVVALPGRSLEESVPPTLRDEFLESGLILNATEHRESYKYPGRLKHESRDYASSIR